MKRILAVSLLLLCLCGCSDKEGDSFAEHLDRKCPYIEYRNSSFNFDPYNRIIQVEEGYELDEGHSYDIVETETGYDVVLHFVENEGVI